MPLVFLWLAVCVNIVFQNHDSFLLPLFPSKLGLGSACIMCVL